MADIIRKNDGGIARTRGAEWDPMRMMRDLFRWDPFREMAPFAWPEEPAGFVPSFEVKETQDGYVFKADVPGIKESDLEVAVTGNRLTVSGRRAAERKDKGETYYAYERSYGSFTRAFTLPEGTDLEHMVADLKEGVLTITVPKGPEAKQRKVEVNTPKPKA